MTQSIIAQVSNYLSLDEVQIRAMARKAPKTYRKYFIDKKNGGKREIFHPAKQTKALQYALIEIVLSGLPVHDAAVAYRPGIKSPLLMNAMKHGSLPFTVRIDCHNFFPSITPGDLERIMRNSKDFADMPDDDVRFIQSACFVRYRDGHLGLAIGAPTSPIISNAVMYDLDSSIFVLTKKISNESVFTRYADDIVFSTNVKGHSATFVKELQKLFDKTASPKLKINREKTVYSSRASKRRVTGLFICPDGTISIGHKMKRYIRKLLFDFKKETLSKEQTAYLRGYIAFTLDVEPKLYNRLAIKYGGELLKKVRQG
jgi:RNA-directed DNA polymerase